MIRKRELGSAKRFPRAPAAIRTAAIDAAWPTQIVETSFLKTYCMVS